MSALDNMDQMIEAMKSRREELTKFEGLLAQISSAMADIVTCMEKPDDDMAVANAITEGLRGIKFPDVQVNVPAQPDINVTVQPAQVVVMPSKSSPIPGFKCTVTARDGNGNIREFLIKPEN